MWRLGGKKGIIKSDKFGLMGLATVESQYLDGSSRYTCSDRTVADIDSEIMKLLKECYEEAKEMLSGNREIMDKLAAFLIEKETISGKEFMKIYREMKGIPEPEEEDEKKPVQSEEHKGQTVDIIVDDNHDTQVTEEAPKWTPPTPGPDNQSETKGRFSKAPL